MTKLSICVIGAGAAGLMAVRHLNEDPLIGQIVCFEQTERIGGTWVFDESEVRHSSMYDKLITNLPKELMAFPDIPFSDSIKESFVKRTKVLKYLDSIGEPIKKFILFNNKVRRIERIPETCKWKVFFADSKSLTAFDNTKEFDVIFFCNGHFSVPRFLPCQKKYDGNWIHSRDYIRADPYRNQVVAIVGCAFSGMDILQEVSEVAKKVYLLHKYHYLQRFQNPVVEEKACLADADSNALILEGGERLEHLDSVIFCTGYIYEFPPILEGDKSGKSKSLIHLLHENQMVSPLFQHCVHVNFPNSLFFIGLNRLVVPFVLFEQQIRFAQVFMHRMVKIEELDLFGFEAKRLQRLQAEMIPLQNFHILNAEQWSYYEELREIVEKCANAKNCIKLKAVPAVFQKIYDRNYQNIIENPRTFKTFIFKIVDTENFEINEK